MQRQQTGNHPAVWTHDAPRGEWELLLNTLRAQDHPHTDTIRWLELLLYRRADHEPIRLVTGNAGAMAISNAIRDTEGAWDA